MADSVLAAKMKTTAPSNGISWDRFEAAVEVIVAAMATVTITTGPVTIADGADSAQGVTTGAAVVTDANGTVQQYLRGLVKLQAPVTPHFANLAASTSADIPSGAKGYMIAVLTGTAAIGSATALPAGVSVSDARTLAAAITVTTDSASTALLCWNT